MKNIVSVIHWTAENPALTCNRTYDSFIWVYFQHMLDHMVVSNVNQNENYQEISHVVV